MSVCPVRGYLRLWYLRLRYSPRRLVHALYLVSAAFMSLLLPFLGYFSGLLLPALFLAPLTFLMFLCE